MLRKKVFLYVSFVKSVQFVCAIINIEKLIVFIKKFIQYLVFFILIGLCAH